MMSIGAALNAATTLVGHALPAGRAGEGGPVRTTRTFGARKARQTMPGATIPGATILGEATPGERAPAEATLLVAVEAGLREAGYLAN